jgi:hypothetical protein
MMSIRKETAWECVERSRGWEHTILSWMQDMRYDTTTDMGTWARRYRRLERELQRQRAATKVAIADFDKEE